MTASQESAAVRTAMRDLFIMGLESALNNYTDHNRRLSDARAAVEAVQKDEQEDWYEDIALFGSLTPKEKIVCMATVTRLFLHSTDMKQDEWYEMWFQATCYVIFEGMIEALEMEADTGISKARRTIFAQAFNTWFAESIADEGLKPAKPNMNSKMCREYGELLWNSLVDSTAEPWADEDFMLDLDYGHPPKSDESDFRRSLSYLLGRIKIFSKEQ